VRKRRARLITSAEESFAHIRRMREDLTGMDELYSVSFDVLIDSSEI
jgi:hypothetical protein